MTSLNEVTSEHPPLKPTSCVPVMYRVFSQIFHLFTFLHVLMTKAQFGEKNTYTFDSLPPHLVPSLVPDNGPQGVDSLKCETFCLPFSAAVKQHVRFFPLPTQSIQPLSNTVVLFLWAINFILISAEYSIQQLPSPQSLLQYLSTKIIL